MNKTYLMKDFRVDRLLKRDLIHYKKSQNVTEGKGPSRNCLHYRVLALREQLNVHNTLFCEKRFRDNVDRFRNVSAHELYCLNAFQISR